MAMVDHKQLSDHQLWQMLRQRTIRFGGNSKLKIYGLLHCASGKRMNKENRVFFGSEKEVLENGYRPCGHCMKEQYKDWKANGFV